MLVFVRDLTNEFLKHKSGVSAKTWLRSQKNQTYIDGLDECSRLTMFSKLGRINVAPDFASRRLPHLHEELSSGRSRMRLLALVLLTVELVGVEQVKRVVEMTGHSKCARRLDLIAGKTVTVHLFKYH